MYVCVRACLCTCAQGKSPKTGKTLRRKIEEKIGNEKRKEEEEGERDKYTLPSYLLSPTGGKIRERKRSEEEEEKEEEARERRKRASQTIQVLDALHYFSIGLAPDISKFFLELQCVCVCVFALPSTFYM